MIGSILLTRGAGLGHCVGLDADAPEEPQMTDRRLRSAWRTARIAAVSLALGAAALVGAGGSTTVPSTVPTATAAGQLCLTGPESRVRADSQLNGVDPNSLTLAQSTSIQTRVAKRMKSRNVSDRSLALARRATVDVYVHVITRADGSGGVTRAQVRDQIAVLNDGFAGRTAGAAATTQFRFRTASIDYTRNDDWYDWSVDDPKDDDDTEAKLALHQGGYDDLNLYVAGLGGGLLGYAYYPWEATPTQDGVVLLNESLPGGDAAPYNEGDTATHEVGHWLGLAHTFENGCATPGDWVGDTPYQDDGDNIFVCNEALDTCPSRGRDPVHNFMSYGDDPCLDRFTAGQSRRMSAIWVAFRAGQRVLP